MLCVVYDCELIKQMKCLQWYERVLQVTMQYSTAKTPIISHSHAPYVLISCCTLSLSPSRNIQFSCHCASRWFLATSWSRRVYITIIYYNNNFVILCVHKFGQHIIIVMDIYYERASASTVAWFILQSRVYDVSILHVMRITMQINLSILLYTCINRILFLF